MTPQGIRKGDVVKFINKDDPRITVTTFAKEDFRPTGGLFFSAKLGITLHFDDWDLELVERPLPSIDEELIQKVRSVFVMASPKNNAHWRAAINYLREHDNHIKENA